MRPVRLRLCTAGSCKQFEHAILANYRLRVVRFPAMFAVIEHPTEGLALFDTGYARRFFDATHPFPERLYRLATPVALTAGQSAVEQLAAMGYADRDVRVVLMSHFHADHISGIRDFPRARLRCFGAAWRTLPRRSRFGAVRHGFLPALLPGDAESRLDMLDTLAARPLPSDCAPFECGGDLFGDGSVLTVELRGHAAGQCGLIVHADDGRRYFLVADACWTREAYERRVMPSAVARWLFHDSRAYARTLDQLAALHERQPDTVIVPSHCERTLETFGWRQDAP